MKKLFFIALAGMMMFAFTQCGGGAFSATKSAINDAISSIEKAEKCEDLDAAFGAFEKEMDEIKKKYAKGDDSDKEILTEDEKKEIKDLKEKFTEAYANKFIELCK